MVVDDEPVMRGAVRELLEDVGFAVVAVAGDGRRAVELARRVVPDAVLMDVRMPEMDGLEATRRIRTMLPGVQVVLLSAYDDPSFKTTAKAAGAFAYLVKGCDPGEVEEVLRSAARSGRGDGA
jgi:DNA-binding NarL/FixJ family response regulator